MIQQQGVAALSKTAKVERLQENFAIFDFELKLDEMVAIAALAEPGGRLISPPGLTPDWD